MRNITPQTACATRPRWPSWRCHSNALHRKEQSVLSYYLTRLAVMSPWDDDVTNGDADTPFVEGLDADWATCLGAVLGGPADAIRWLAPSTSHISSGTEDRHWTHVTTHDHTTCEVCEVTWRVIYMWSVAVTHVSSDKCHAQCKSILTRTRTHIHIYRRSTNNNEYYDVSAPNNRLILMYIHSQT